ncbi:hypothetical protein ACTFIT_001615 [Dictyostelium discoideum]
MNDNKKYYIYSKNSKFSDYQDKDSIAFGEDCGSLLKFKLKTNIKRVMLLDGFKESLEPGVLPNDGFSQTLKPGVIPKTIRIVTLHQITKPLVIGSIPNTVLRIEFHKGFNQFLTPGIISEAGIIPEGVKSLEFHQVKYLLIVGSIPNSIYLLCLLDGFNQIISPGIITNGVCELGLGEIKQPLFVNSIPNSVTKFNIINGFYH